VRDLLRGAPDTQVKVRFERPGVPAGKEGIELTLTRRLVRVPDVKLTTFLGPLEDGIGYVQLQGFSQGAPTELRLSLEMLRMRAPEGLKGLILDLRGNPGGLLTSAVDVASLLVPKGSEIVSAK
jgi:carboxyl-terminal processing protease